MFQWLMQKTFDPQISHNLEVYVDDIIIKSFKADDHVRDLAETFANLNRNNIKLNPEKCIFGVQSSKVLMVGASGVGANPEKIEAIDCMRPPATAWDIQCLMGCVDGGSSATG